MVRTALSYPGLSWDMRHACQNDPQTGSNQDIGQYAHYKTMKSNSPECIQCMYVSQLLLELAAESMY